MLRRDVDDDGAMTIRAEPSTPSQHWIVRPGQIRIRDLRAGIVAMDDTDVVLQVHVGATLPIRRVGLVVGQRVVVNGWRLQLRHIDTGDRGSVLLELTPPHDGPRSDRLP